MAGEPNSDLSRPAAWRRPLQGNGRALPQRKDRLLMAKPATLDGYSDQYTVDCERVLVTLLRGLGPWKDSVYLVGGLTPRYLVAARPPAVHAPADRQSVGWGKSVSVRLELGG